MEKALAEFTLEDGTSVIFEVPEPIDDSAIEEVGIGDQVYKAQQSFEAALDRVKPVASAVMSRFKDGMTTPADEVEVKFGINLSADAGVIFSCVGGEVNFEVTLKWQNQK